MGVSGTTEGVKRTTRICLDMRSDIINRAKHYVCELEMYQRFWYYLALFVLMDYA